MLRILALLILSCAGAAAFAAGGLPPYSVQAGDLLQVSVWKEPDLQLEVLVRPDGGFSMPLIGEVAAAGKSVAALQEELTKRLAAFVPDASVTVAIHQLNGNKIYVLGKVGRPGEYPVNRYVDVMQALSMAGGTTTFANLSDIVILHRADGGSQRAIAFNYDQVSSGKHLEQNIILQSGDVVVVP